MGGQNSTQIIVQQANDIVATIMTNIATYCVSDDISDQILNIECNPPLTSGKVFENNDACLKCLDNIVFERTSYYNLQESLWKSGEQKPKVRLPINQDYQNTIQKFIDCTTSNICKACVVQDISQKTLLSSVIDCKAFSNVKNTIDQQLMESITQKLTNHQDVLSPLARMLGASNSDDVVENLANRASTLLSVSVISNIQQQISSFQTLSINFKTKGLTKNITQNSAYHSVQSYLQKTNLMNNIFTELEWKQLEDLINDQTTITALGDLTTKAIGILTKVLKSVLGKIVIFILILIGIIFTGIILYISIKLIKKEIQQQLQNPQDSRSRDPSNPTFQYQGQGRYQGQYQNQFDTPQFTSTANKTDFNSQNSQNSQNSLNYSGFLPFAI